MMPSLTSRKRGWSSIKANEPRCNPAASVMPSMPAESAPCSRTRSVSFGAFMVSFSMTVDENHAGAAFGFHGLAHVQAGRFGDVAEVELDIGLVGILDVVLELQELGLDEVGLVAAVRNRGQHGVGNMAYSAQTGSLQSQYRGGDVHAHTPDDDRDQLLFAEFQAKIIYTFHCFSRS